MKNMSWHEATNLERTFRKVEQRRGLTTRQKRIWEATKEELLERKPKEERRWNLKTGDLIIIEVDEYAVFKGTAGLLIIEPSSTKQNAMCEIHWNKNHLLKPSVEYFLLPRVEEMLTNGTWKLVSK